MIKRYAHIFKTSDVFLEFAIFYLASTDTALNVFSGIAARATNTSAANCIASRCDPVLNSIQHRGFGALSIAVQKLAAIGPMQHKTLLKLELIFRIYWFLYE